MKVLSSIFLGFALSADAFVIQRANPASVTTTTLKDVGLQWGFDENGCRAEYYLEHWSERNKDGLQSKWAYDPWSGISQTIFIPGQAGAEIAARSMVTRVEVQAPAEQQAFALPPAQPAEIMPEVPQPMPEVVQAGGFAPDYAEQLKRMTSQ